MRTACVECVRKHIGSASAAIDESLLGHPENSTLAEGYLDQAASEAMRIDMRFALELREFRRQYSAAFQLLVTGAPVDQIQTKMPDVTALLVRTHEWSLEQWLKPAPDAARK